MVGVRRLFVAVWLPEEVLDVVARLSRPEVPGLRWTRRAQWHVTLRFLGGVPDAEMPVAVEALGAVGGTGEVDAGLGPAVGRFGSRMLHVPVSGLDALAGRVVDATVGLGRPPDERVFGGHLTLARVAKAAKVDLGCLAGEAISERWTVEDVCLVQSHLEPTGARYEVLERFPLAPP